MRLDALSSSNAKHLESNKQNKINALSEESNRGLLPKTNILCGTHTGNIIGRVYHP